MEKGIGAHIPRREDFRLLTGAGKYADDMRADGQVYGYALRAYHAHARLKSTSARRRKRPAFSPCSPAPTTPPTA